MTETNYKRVRVHCDSYDDEDSSNLLTTFVNEYAEKGKPVRIPETKYVAGVHQTRFVPAQNMFLVNGVVVSLGLKNGDHPGGRGIYPLIEFQGPSDTVDSLVKELYNSNSIAEDGLFWKRTIEH